MLEAITTAVIEGLADAKRAKKAAAPVVAAKVFDLIQPTTIQLASPAETPASEPVSALATVPSGLADVYAEAFEAGKNYALKCAFEGVVDQPANPYEGA